MRGRTIVWYLLCVALVDAVFKVKFPLPPQRDSGKYAVFHGQGRTIKASVFAYNSERVPQVIHKRRIFARLDEGIVETLCRSFPPTYCGRFVMRELTHDHADVLLLSNEPLSLPANTASTIEQPSVLGVYAHHDANACVMLNGRIVAVLELERLFNIR